MTKRLCPINPEHELSTGFRTDKFEGLSREERLRLKRIQRCGKTVIHQCYDCDEHYLFLNDIYTFNGLTGEWEKLNIKERVVFN